MNGFPINPYALYVFCDGAMDYNSKNTGGIGFEIIFPEAMEIESIQTTIGRYEGANIERLELEAILQGMNKLLETHEKQKELFKNIPTIIFVTDRFGLNDAEKTNPYKIREWRKNKWHNHEGKAIKNADLLDKIDKTRKKITEKLYCGLNINYGRRKFNKTANKLAKAGKSQPVVKKDIAAKGEKIGKRKFQGDTVNYEHLEKGKEYLVHIYKKEAVVDQYEISAEFCEGPFQGKKLKIYSDYSVEKKLKRRNEFLIRLKNVFKHHVVIFKTIKQKQKIINE